MVLGSVLRGEGSGRFLVRKGIDEVLPSVPKSAKFLVRSREMEQVGPEEDLGGFPVSSPCPCACVSTDLRHRVSVKITFTETSDLRH